MNKVSRPQLFELVQGSPGTGKTHLTKAIMMLAKLYDAGHCIFTAPTGIAAAQGDGNTIFTMFNITAYDNPNEDLTADVKLIENDIALSNLRKRIHADTLCFVAIDEISMVTPYGLSAVDARLRQAIGNDQPFGGVSILLIGDFSQLPPIPVSGALCTCAVKQAMDPQKLALKYGKTFLRGIDLFRSFELTSLLEQQRAKYDLDHTEMLERMGKGESLMLEDLAQFKTLSKDDIIADKDWLFAPILVATN